MFKNKTKNNNSYKKLPCKKLFAFTLGEILLVFAFIGVIAVTYAIDSRPKIDSMQKKLLLYNAFKSIDLASREIARDNNKTIPDDGATFCLALADLFNTVGDINCGNNLTSYGTNFSNPNFITSNGMSFYNVSAAPIADISDASELITNSELSSIQTKATNKAKSEIDSVMNTIGAEAEKKARAALPSRSYVVEAKYTKYEEGNSELISNNNGSYQIRKYNYTIEYSHKGTKLPKTGTLYTSNAECYEVITPSNALYQELAYLNPCSNFGSDYTQSFTATSEKYNDLKTAIDTKYTQEENAAINEAINEATSATIRSQELDKLYQKYYNQYFQELYDKKAASLPKVHNIYVDINGSRGKSKLDEDVFLFIVRSDGKTVPAKNSALSNNVDIISAGYYTRNNKPISTKLSFRQAACSTARFLEEDYKTNGYCSGLSVDTANCPRKNACYYKINQPKSMWSLF